MESVPVSTLKRSNRSKLLRDHFTANFKREPKFYVRVPGRVNLIGEHIDYCGYGVCPMALEQDIFLAIAENENNTLYLSNIDATFSNFDCQIDQFSITVEDGGPQWYEYFLCGLKGVLEILPKNVKAKGFYVVVSGTIPQSAGLSSSSALVSAAALATAYIHNIAISKEEIASLCAKSERYIGTQGGGMDQAIAFLATQGCAKFIEFAPLRSKDIALPQGAVFVIAHSLAKLNKAATNDFNCRVVECRLAAQIIAKSKGLDWKSVKQLGPLQQMLGFDLENMIDLVRETLHELPYTREEVLKVLETTEDVLDETSFTPNTKHVQQFKLQQRALHVFQEALRVQRFHDTCRDSKGDDTALETLGRLMSESHESLRDLYECSHPELDRLVELSQGVTLGARLTGAGWGGCIVALLRSFHVDKYMRKLRDEFYQDHPNVGQNLDFVLFNTAPNTGAEIYIVE